MDVLTQSDFISDDFLGTSTRRVFVKGLGYVGASLLLAGLGGCEKIAEQIRNRPVRRRIRAGSSAVDADVATYRDAVRLMKALGMADPRNWLAQATIHGTAAGFNMCEHGTSHFFDWHRAYLFYFEKICQKLTGKPKFGLPYWNWNQDPGVPAPFLDTASTLFSTRFRTSMSGSPAVTTPTLDVIFGDTNFFTFSSQLEGTPHNNVHTWIGGTLGQGNSPLDPLFWCHHCMIDYCWYKWNGELGRSNTNDATWINKVNGQFVDADGNPATTKAGITILLPLLAYRYESSAIGSSPAQIEIKSAKEFRALEARLRAGAPIAFRISHRARLSERADLGGGKPALLRSPVRSQDFSALIESGTAPQRLFLAVEQADVPKWQDFYVRVFVNLVGAGPQTSTDDPHFAGSFAFFGNPAAQHPASHAAGEAEHPRFLVDLTHTLRALQSKGALDAAAPLTVQLVPTPIGEQTKLEGVPLALRGIDIIASPVIVSPAEGKQ